MSNNISLPKVELYSDWWANPNPGPGGYGIILCYKNIKKEFYQVLQNYIQNGITLYYF